MTNLRLGLPTFVAASVSSLGLLIGGCGVSGDTEQLCGVETGTTCANYDLALTTWAPDDNGGHAVLSLVDSTSGGSLALREVESLFNPIAVSPDGMLLAYTTHTDAHIELRVLELATGEEKLVDTALINRAAAPVSFVGNPAWSPDGQSLTYLRLAEESSIRMWSPTRGVTTLAPVDVQASSCVRPQWLDDDTVVYSGWELSDGGVLRTVKVGTKTVRDLFNPPGTGATCDVAPSGDGRIAFTYGDSVGADFTWRLAVLTPGDGTGTVVPSLDRALAGGVGTGQAAWSPDNSSIAFVEVVGEPGDNEAMLRILDLPKKSVRDVDILNASVTAGRPAWSPDGSELAYVRFNSYANRAKLVVATLGAAITIRETQAPLTGIGPAPRWRF